MDSITGQFSNNRKASGRYKRFYLLVGIFLLVAGFAAAGFFLYDSSDPHTEHVAQAGNTLPKDWLIKYFASEDENDPAIGGANGDPDKDILTNIQEFYFGTDPLDPDSDDDGQLDGAEVALNENPLGEGEIYSTDFAKQVAGRFIELNELDELKAENIQKSVVELLNPPNNSEVQIALPDPKSLKVKKDFSKETIEKYFEDMSSIGIGLNPELEILREQLENPNSLESSVTLSSIYSTINDLRDVTVPVDFLRFHQLIIAGLFASANIFEISKQENPIASLETSQPLIAEQYYQVSVIQKIEAELAHEVELLALRFQDYFNE